MSKKFLTDVIVQSAEMPAVAANRLAADLIAAIKAEIIETGRFTLPDFGAFVVRETPKRTALNPRTGEKVAVKAGATVKFKASPSLNSPSTKCRRLMGDTTYCAIWELCGTTFCDAGHNHRFYQRAVENLYAK